MNFRGKMAFVLGLMLVFGCAEENEDAAVPDLLHAVPSDALAVISGACRTCLSELDSSHVFRSIGLERYSGKDAVLAYCYTSSLSPVLILDADVDTSVISKAGRVGVPMLETEDRVIFTISESTMSAVRRHLSMGTSILDAPGFNDVVMKVASGRHWAVLRNSEVSKILPRTVLNGFYDRKDLVRLLRNTCEWTGFRWTREDEVKVYLVNGGTDLHVSKLMAALKPMSSKLPGILPAATEIAVDMPVEPKSFRKAYVAYLDATQRLSQYEKALDALRKETGIDPVKWENSAGIKELAIVGWEGRKVVLVRPSVSSGTMEAGDNPYSRFTSVLYGFLFDPGDDSFCAMMDGWLVMGSENDVRVFLDEERPEIFEWPSHPLKFAGYMQNYTISWTRDNLTVTL